MGAVVQDGPGDTLEEGRLAVKEWLQGILAVTGET